MLCHRHAMSPDTPTGCWLCEKNARIAELKSALAKAEEALNAFQEDHGCCPTCGRYINGEDHTKGCLYGAALAGIKEARHD